MSSREDISALHALGWTNAAIGRAVGRDSSLIHQIATGKKPGANLTPTLDALRASGLQGPKTARQVPNVRLPEAPRRTRASGQPARVREGRIERERRGPARSMGGPTGGAGGAGRGGRGGTSAPRSTPGGARSLPNGQQYVSGSSKASANFAAGLTRDLGEHARVKITYKDTNGKWHTLGQKGGLTPEALKGYTRGRSWKQALAEMAQRFYGRGAAEPTGEAEFYIVGA